MTLSNACRAGLLALSVIATPASARDETQGNPVGTAPGPLDGNWRVTRADDPFDAALMLMQIQRTWGRACQDFSGIMRGCAA